MHNMALHDQRYHQHVCEPLEGASTAMDCSKGFLPRKYCSTLLSGNSGLFVELVAVTDNASFIPSSSVITRRRLGERNKYVEGRPCAIHTWSR